MDGASLIELMGMLQAEFSRALQGLGGETDQAARAAALPGDEPLVRGTLRGRWDIGTAGARQAMGGTAEVEEATSAREEVDLAI
ncbi:MAG TPA: hypothetical protein VF615_13020 [Longimicrobiaceae bacterium]